MKEETLKTSNLNLVQFLNSALLERKWGRWAGSSWTGSCRTVQVLLDRVLPDHPGPPGPPGSHHTVQVPPVLISDEGGQMLTSFRGTMSWTPDPEAGLDQRSWFQQPEANTSTLPLSQLQLLFNRNHIASTLTAGVSKHTAHLAPPPSLAPPSEIQPKRPSHINPAHPGSWQTLKDTPTDMKPRPRP